MRCQPNCTRDVNDEWTFGMSKQTEREYCNENDVLQMNIVCACNVCVSVRVFVEFCFLLLFEMFIFSSSQSQQMNHG